MQCSADPLSASGVDTFLTSANTQVAWYPSAAVSTALDGYVRGEAQARMGSMRDALRAG
jgi:hypothetical protein